MFIRIWVVVPQIRHSLTRYGSRENAAFFSFVLSVRISTVTSWGVVRLQAEHVSVTSVVPFLTAIPIECYAERGIKIPHSSGPFRPFIAVQKQYSDLSASELFR